MSDTWGPERITMTREEVRATAFQRQCEHRYYEAVGRKVSEDHLLALELKKCKMCGVTFGTLV